MLSEFRKKNFINKSFQTRFIFYTLTPSLLLIFCLHYASQYYFALFLEAALKLNLNPESPIYMLITQQKQIFNTLLLTAAICFILFYVVWGLLMSHRIAGPLLKLVNYLKTKPTSEGVEEMSFRKNDFFKEIPEAMKEFLKNNNLKIKDKKK